MPPDADTQVRLRQFPQRRDPEAVSRGGNAGAAEAAHSAVAEVPERVA